MSEGRKKRVKERRKERDRGGQGNRENVKINDEVKEEIDTFVILKAAGEVRVFALMHGR